MYKDLYSLLPNYAWIKSKTNRGFHNFVKRLKPVYCSVFNSITVEYWWEMEIIKISPVICLIFLAG